MYLNGYSVRIPEGSEKEASGYVEMSHGTQYTIQLRNQRNTRCDAEVTIDGKYVGTFRIERYGNLRLERSADDDRRFTFYLRDSEEGEAVELDKVSKSDLGLVQVTFKPEKEPKVIHKVVRDPGLETSCRKGIGSCNCDCDCDNNDHSSTYSAGVNVYNLVNNENFLRSSTFGGSTKGISRSDYQAGGTGMSGHSSQNFYDVAALDYDHEHETTISLRLVAINRRTPGPLKPVQKQNPVPPPVWII